MAIDRTVEFDDRFAGRQSTNVARLGDFVIAKSDGTAAYQLAVVVDDLAGQVTEIVRGSDLLESTFRQILLYEALGAAKEIPRYTHLPLVVGTDGRRLAKRHGDTRIATYRELGVPRSRMLGLLAKWCGMNEAGREIDDPRQLIDRFHLTAISAAPVVFTADDPGAGTPREICMTQSRDACFRRVMDGSDGSIAAVGLRTAASCVEPIYAGTMLIRNVLYDAGIPPIHCLGRPTISVGNITTGGTGKTPMVRWLVKSLSDQRPCVLLRGYKSTKTDMSDEQAMLESEGIAVIADRDRRRGADAALARHPEITVFVLDDGMQHRRAARDFELVLIHAREAFGLERVFPRGMLREPLEGLRRADAIVVTHADEIDPAGLAKISAVIQRHNQHAEIFHADHVIGNLRSAEGNSMPVQSLAGKRYFAVCGIGSPASFFWRLGTMGGTCVGNRAFADHHDYRERDVPSGFWPGQVGRRPERGHDPEGLGEDVEVRRGVLHSGLAGGSGGAILGRAGRETVGNDSGAVENLRASRGMAIPRLSRGRARCRK